MHTTSSHFPHDLCIAHSVKCFAKVSSGATCCLPFITAEAPALPWQTSFTLLQTSLAFLQVAAYSEVSIRELLKWVKLILQELHMDRKTTSVKGHGVPPQLLSDTAYAVYAARFRTSDARVAITQLYTSKIGWPMPAMTSAAELSARGAGHETSIKAVYKVLSMQWLEPSSCSRRNDSPTAITGSSASVLPAEVLEATEAAHAIVVKLAARFDFIDEHGLYFVQKSWLEQWLAALAEQGVAGALEMDVAGWLGVYMYCRRFRHAAARAAVAAAFASSFGLVEDEVCAFADRLGCCSGRSMGADAALDLLSEKVPGVHLCEVEPERPFVVTARVLRAWQVAGRALKAGEPLLVKGRDGCGKSALLKAFAGVVGSDLRHFNLTPGTLGDFSIDGCLYQTCDGLYAMLDLVAYL